MSRQKAGRKLRGQGAQKPVKTFVFQRKKKKDIFIADGIDWPTENEIFCRVSSVPVKCSKWELCAELGDGCYTVDVTKSANVFTVSINHPLTL